jgi:hypothetical protein
MKKCSLLIVLLIIIFSVESQNLEVKQNIKRVNWNLAVADSISQKNIKLDKKQLQVMLTNEQFHDYKTAKNCMKASTSMFAISAPPIGMGFFFLGVAFRDLSKGKWEVNPITHLGGAKLAFTLSGFCIGGALLPLIPGIVLMPYGIKKIDKIVFDYNSSSLHSFNKQYIKMNFGFTSNGIGINLNF